MAEFSYTVCVCIHIINVVRQSVLYWGLQVSISSEIERTQSETDRTLTSQGTSTEQIGKSLDSAVQDAEKELKKDQTAQQVQPTLLLFGVHHSFIPERLSRRQNRCPSRWRVK